MKSEIDALKQKQWLGLHNEVIALDRQANVIKLVILLGLVFVQSNGTGSMLDMTQMYLMVLLGAGGWFIEACARVYQARAMERLENLEQLETKVPMNVYWHYAGGRGVSFLLREYARAMLSPTVALYYCGLLVVALSL